MGKGGGGGGLRILPHKSWNVYGWKNKLKVKEDEAKHAAEEKVQRQKQQVAEAEFRLSMLRQKAQEKVRRDGGADLTELSSPPSLERVPSVEQQSRYKDSGDTNAETGSRRGKLKEKRPKKRARVIIDGDDEEPQSKGGVSSVQSNDGLSKTASSAREHINLFADAERAIKAAQKNKEAEAEKKAKADKDLQKLMPTIFFGEFALDAEGKKPWYATGLSREEAAAELRDIGVEKAPSAKAILDPLAGIQASLGKAPTVVHSAAQSSFHRAKQKVMENAKLLGVHASQTGAVSSNSNNLTPKQREDLIRAKLAAGGYQGVETLSSLQASAKAKPNLVTQSDRPAIGADAIPIETSGQPHFKSHISAEDAEIARLQRELQRLQDSRVAKLQPQDSSSTAEQDEEEARGSDVSKRKKNHSKDKHKRKHRSRSRSRSPEKSKRHKHHKKSSKHRGTLPDPINTVVSSELHRELPSSGVSIEKLREERLQRERRERAKVAMVLNVPNWAVRDRNAFLMSDHGQVAGNKYNSGYANTVMVQEAI